MYGQNICYQYPVVNPGHFLVWTSAERDPDPQPGRTVPAHRRRPGAGTVSDQHRLPPGTEWFKFPFLADYFALTTDRRRKIRGKPDRPDFSAYSKPDLRR